MRPAAAVVLAALAVATPAAAQPDSTVACTELNSRAMEATMVIRQHASVLSTGIGTEDRLQGAVTLAWLDQWTGRLRGLMELGESASCLDDGDYETYRRALAMATRVANAAREELLRPPRTAAQQPQQRRRF